MKHTRQILAFTLLLLYSLVSFAQSYKLSPYLRQILLQYEQKASSRKNGSQSLGFRTIAFVKTNDVKTLKSNDCKILASWDDVHIVSVPLSRLYYLASRPEILRIEANEPCHLTNDTTAQLTGASKLWNYSFEETSCQPLTGNGVVVGVIDVGFDLTHPTFFSSDNQQYRIGALWDQLDWSEGGEPVVGEDTIYVGRQYIGGQTLLGLGHSTDGVILFHGTHTSGTAAGSGNEGYNGTANKYVGMAPGADICLVSNFVGDNRDLVPEGRLPLYTTATDMLGFKYIFDYAQSVNKPCVINFSQGCYDNLYDNQLYEEVLGKLVGNGRIICASAGNEGNNYTYIHKLANSETAGAFLRSSSTMAYYTLCSDKPVQLALTFYLKDGHKKELKYDMAQIEIPKDSAIYDTLVIDTSRYVIGLATYSSCYDTLKTATELLVVDLQNEKFCSNGNAVSLKLEGIGNEVEGYASGGYFCSDNRDSALKDYDKTHNVFFPGSSRHVICVGNCSYRTTFRNVFGVWRSPYGTSETNGVRTRYSSVGPSMSGLIKPDVMAPGMNVISALSSWYRDADLTDDDNDVSYFEYNGRTYGWYAESGTSMSAPVVTGIVAQWLQLCPELTPDDIKEVFQYTCDHYDENMQWPNNEYGWGCIDAVAGAEYIRKHFLTALDEIKENHAEGVFRVYDLLGRQVRMVSHGIYISNGKLMIIK